ncbi:MAG TPA: helix-turn-helix transcriptional regulator [Burkholderiaceae bacterium]
MRLGDSNQVLSDHLNRLLSGSEVARIELAKRMGVADGTLGRIKYGKGNPTIDVVDKIARFYRVQPWELLRPVQEGVAEDSADYVIDPVASRLHEWIDKLDTQQRLGLLQLLKLT